MEGLFTTLTVFFVAQFCLLWYKMGKIESHLKALNGKITKEGKHDNA